MLKASSSARKVSVYFVPRGSIWACSVGAHPRVGGAQPGTPRSPPYAGADRLGWGAGCWESNAARYDSSFRCRHIRAGTLSMASQRLPGPDAGGRRVNGVSTCLHDIHDEVGKDEHRDIVLSRDLIVDGCNFLLGRPILDHPRMSFRSFDAHAGLEWKTIYRLVTVLAEGAAAEPDSTPPGAKAGRV